MLKTLILLALCRENVAKSVVKAKLCLNSNSDGVNLVQSNWNNFVEDCYRVS